MQNKTKDIYDIDWRIAEKVAADQYAKSLQEFIDAVGSENVETYNLNGEAISYVPATLKGSKEDFDKLISPSGDSLEETFGRQYGDEVFDRQINDAMKGSASDSGVTCMHSCQYTDALNPSSDSVRAIAGITITTSTNQERVIISDMPELEVGAKTVKFKLADSIYPVMSLSKDEDEDGAFLRLTVDA